jgi:hypothetical protein
MWNRCFAPGKKWDNDRTSIQSWKKNSVRNLPFWLSKVQEALPRSTEQEDYFDIADWHLGLLRFLKPKAPGKTKKVKNLFFRIFRGPKHAGALIFA